MKFKQKSQILAFLALSAVSTLAAALEEGDTVPIFDLPSIYSDQPAISTASLEGKTVYVDFWASWCAPCLTSLPLYNDMYHKYKDQGLEIVAINVDNPIEDGLDFLEDAPLDFLIPADPEGDAAELFEVIGMPTSYLIQPDGTVTLVHMGFRSGDIDMIEEAIQASLSGN
ncbi:MAG: TlpA disulfide reductase family protein [Gammaproteobacteria bacterium]|jgi:thiol-disulfide isomerase/thioredoxin|nr:TlpA disulfide reductase family protein [Gammaproteobacteria bacterium]MDG2338165.1 TlpA disulfide reductase family protein [Gammaproteobacteria bacterium]